MTEPAVRVPWRLRWQAWWNRPRLSSSLQKWVEAAKPHHANGPLTLDAIAIATLSAAEVKALLAVVDVEVDDVERHARQALPQAKATPVPTLQRVFVRTSGRAFARERNGDVDPADLYLALLAEDECVAMRTALAKLRIAHIDLWRAHAHGECLRDELAQDPVIESDEGELVVHNDDVTTQEFVARVFAEILGFDEQRAVAAMLEVHRTDEAVVHRGPPRECIALRRKLIDAAVAANMPLRVSVR